MSLPRQGKCRFFWGGALLGGDIRGCGASDVIVIYTWPFTALSPPRFSGPMFP